MADFSHFGLKKFLNDGLEQLNFAVPTECQLQVIPLMLKHQNVLCESQTGTGKTLAFCLPILNNIKYDQQTLQAVIITPTRELAKQIHQVITFFAKLKPELSVNCLIGGDDLERQKEHLSTRMPQIVVGTPKRLRTLFESGVLPITLADTLIIDECDMIFDMNFIEDVDFMLSKINKQIKVSIFSATIKEGMHPFLKKYLSNPHLIMLSKKQVTNPNITHVLVLTKQKAKKDILGELLRTFDPYICLIFVNRKEDMQTYHDVLTAYNLPAVQLHANLQSRERQQILKRINNLEFKYVLCSDVASRGLDIDGVSHVVSIDLPHDLEYYIHRSGRTGRGQYTGFSYVLYDLRDQAQVDVLSQMGIKFMMQRIVDHQLVTINKQTFNPVGKTVSSKPKTHHLTKTDQAINVVVQKYKARKQKVKPNYRKKMKEEIAAAKSQVRREHIKESIKHIKKEQAKKRQKSLLDDD